jgi:alpha-L-rhamnosidase
MTSARSAPESAPKSGVWQAHWITCPGKPLHESGLFHFRRTFHLDADPEHFRIHVSADNGYELYVNGQRVLEGPARGDLDHWRYETLDIAPYLKKGKNALAAVVYNYADLAPMAQMSNETAFLLQGEGPEAAVLNTDDRWRVTWDDGLRLIPWDYAKDPAYYVAGPGERWDGSQYPWGWERTDFDDSQWQSPIVFDVATFRGARDSHSRWMLVTPTLPLQEDRTDRLARVVRSEGVDARAGFLEGQSSIVIPAGANATILLDELHLTSTYPELVVSGGRGSEVKLTYAEALLAGADPLWKNGKKGNRNETAGKRILGLEDVFLPDGGSHRLFRPLWWRTYRFLQVAVATKGEPLTLEDIRGRFTAYPFMAKASFHSNDPELERIWDVGWRTARLCAHTTYTDTPYYEQLQYVGDTRIQALISLYVAGDDRLVKNAIDLIAESQIPEGITQSRYPSRLPQLIPGFSLMWIGMMHDLWWYHGDNDFLKAYLPGVRSVLSWWEACLTPSGLVGPPEWWHFVDWTEQFLDGVPPQEANGQSAIESLQLAIAFREAADLESSFGLPSNALRDRQFSQHLAAQVYRRCWDASRGLMADTPAKSSFSQHANSLAVLADAIPSAQQAGVMKKVFTDSSFTQASYYFKFYVFRAMKRAGLGDDYLTQLGPWRRMLSLGLTTWAEEPESDEHQTRSDCHAWSAHPNVDLLATVAGVEPGAPGFREVMIHPHLGSLREVTATVPTPRGDVTVKYAHKGSKLQADVTLPAGLSGWFVWKGKRVALHAGQQHFDL